MKQQQQQKTRHQTKFSEMLNPAPWLYNDGKCTGHECGNVIGSIPKRVKPEKIKFIFAAFALSTQLSDIYAHGLLLQ